MPAPVTAGLIAFMIDQLEINPWEGEVPRYDIAGNAINPEQTVTDPSDWPVVTCEHEGDMSRLETFSDAYNDRGSILISVYGVTKEEVQNQLNSIETLWGKFESWQDVPMPGGVSGNPFYVLQMNVLRWTIQQQKDVRLAASQLCWVGMLHYDCNIHGALSTT